MPRLLMTSFIRLLPSLMWRMPSATDPALCAKCKGVRRLCGRPTCPILKRIIESLKVAHKVRKRVLPAATPPSVLVGEHGYPSVRLGPIAAPVRGEEAQQYEDYKGWWGRLSLEDIISIRASTIYSSFSLRVREARSRENRLLEATREAALSARPVDAEFVYAKPPRPSLSFNGMLAPVGLRGELNKLEIVENPIVPRRVDQLVYDTDAKVRDAIQELYRSGIDNYYITRLLSLGMLGEKNRRRLVPTRWAITAVDKMLGDLLLDRVRLMSEYPKLELYSAEYLGNRYLILLAPGPWSFEMVEIWLPRSVWVKESKPYIAVNYELWDGRWRRPGVDGGYYAMRFPVLEFLAEKKRQATVIAIREVTPNYYAPVGSWQIRESVRRALRSKPLTLEDVNEALREISKRIDTSVRLVVRESTILRSLLSPRIRLTDFM